MKESFRILYKQLYARRVILCLIILCSVVLILSTKGITNENSLAMNGDMARYMMNGVYFYDLIREHPLMNPFEHAYRYFARYPALSLGHHPLLLAIAEVPFYAIFGISTFSARLTIVFFVLLATITWFFLIRLLYDELVACLSSLLFVTTPFIVEYSRISMSEIPTLALIIGAAYLFYQYCDSGKAKYAFYFAFIFPCSVYAKHVAVFMIPVFFCYLLIRKGVKKLIAKELIIACLIMALLILPLVIITLKFSQANVEGSIGAPLSSKLTYSNLRYHIKAIWTHHLTLPLAIFGFLGIGGTLYRKDRRAILFFLWIAGCYLLPTYLGVQRPRDAFYWIPVFSFFAATAIHFLRFRFWKICVSVILFGIVGYQFAVGLTLESEYTAGYEDVAKYVVEHKNELEYEVGAGKGTTILYSAVEDTGYFMFFVRKHYQGKGIIILRADKILTTSFMRWFLEDHIQSKEEIYDILHQYGVGFVVIEDKKSDSPALEMLRQEVKSERFILRKAIVMRSNYAKLNNSMLNVYEYKEYVPPKEGAVLDMEIPLMGDDIRLSFSELLQ